jgi:hypothetical protein
MTWTTGAGIVYNPKLDEGAVVFKHDRRSRKFILGHFSDSFSSVHGMIVSMLADRIWLLDELPIWFRWANSITGANTLVPDQRRPLVMRPEY